MTDLSEFYPGPKKCKFGRHLDAMSKEQREKVNAAMLEPSIASYRIAKVMSGWGFQLGENVVGKHRAGGCTCG